MAELRIEGFERLEKMLTELADPKPLIKKALDKVTPHAVKKLQAAIRNGETDRATGMLAASIGSTKVKTNAMGTYAVVLPEGRDPEGIHYAARLNFLEYGVKSHNQPPKPMKGKVAEDARRELLEVTQGLLDEEVAKYK